MDQLISPAELAEALSDPNPPTVIDVRRKEAYRAGHIPGARHIPGDKLEAVLDEIPRDRPVITY